MNDIYIGVYLDETMGYMLKVQSAVYLVYKNSPSAKTELLNKVDEALKSIGEVQKLQEEISARANLKNSAQEKTL